MNALVVRGTGVSLECAALSALWPAAAWRRFLKRTWRCDLYLREPDRGRAWPRPAKAPTTGVPGAAAALGWRGGALQGGVFDPPARQLAQNDHTKRGIMRRTISIFIKASLLTLFGVWCLIPTGALGQQAPKPSLTQPVSAPSPKGSSTLSLEQQLALSVLGEPTAERAAITLVLAQKFAKFDLQRSFELLAAAIKTINQIPYVVTAPSWPPQRRGVSVYSFTMVGGAELTTGNHATLDSLTFQGLDTLVRTDYFRARNLADDILNKIVRARYLLAIARTILDSSRT